MQVRAQLESPDEMSEATAIMTSQDGSVLYDDPNPLRRLFAGKPDETHEPESSAPSTPPVDDRARKLTTGERWAVAIAGLGAVLLGLIGLLMSFETVRATAAAEGVARPWLVPLAIDIGVAVFAATDLVMARLRMRLPWLRMFVWGLVGVMIYLNVADTSSWTGRVIHVALPALWVVVVEIAAHAIQVRAGLAAGEEVYDRIPLWRWILSPVVTFALWRRMKLWRITRYSEAVEWERRRRMVRSRLRDLYGRGWKSLVSRALVEYYRLGQWETLDGEIYHRRLVAAELHDIHGPTWDEVVPRAVVELYRLGEWEQLRQALADRTPVAPAVSQDPASPAEPELDRGSELPESASFVVPDDATREPVVAPADLASSRVMVTIPVPDDEVAVTAADLGPEGPQTLVDQVDEVLDGAASQPEQADQGSEAVEKSLAELVEGVYLEMLEDKQRPTRDAVAKTLRSRGHTAPNGAVGTHLRELKQRDAAGQR